MFEKVNPSHPDKMADRIAGAMVDLAYKKEESPKIAVEVLIGHGKCHIMSETSVSFTEEEIKSIVTRITGEDFVIDYNESPQDSHLAKNQETLHCGDNGIFKGLPISSEEREMMYKIASPLYEKFPFDGKYIINSYFDPDIICQSHASEKKILKALGIFNNDSYIINPLGSWDGGLNSDCGATNRKIGSDMGEAATGGGLHGKDLSKADVSVNIWCHQMAELTGKEVRAYCYIGSENVMVSINHEDFKPYAFSSIVASAKEYVRQIGGFEKLAEWGLIR